MRFFFFGSFYFLYTSLGTICKEENVLENSSKTFIRQFQICGESFLFRQTILQCLKKLVAETCELLQTELVPDWLRESKQPIRGQVKR